MAKKSGAKPETKSEFLRKVLGKDPDLDYPQVNRRWAKAGHAGEISNALYYKVRAELGIKTEWTRVKEEPETKRSKQPGPEGRARPKDDLVKAAESFLPQILMFYKRFEDKRPVMLLELPSLRIYAYPYRDFKENLSERSQAMLEDQYERAIAEDKIVVFVREEETRRLVSMTFDNDVP
jgi:hypothetical protein